MSTSKTIVRADGLSEAVLELIEAMNLEVIQYANAAAKETAKEAVSELKSTSPVRTDGYTRKYEPGSYAKSWTYKAGTDTSTTLSTKVYGVTGYTVYNKEHYSLAHLLEFGHIISGTGRRSQAIEHIAPVNDSASESFVSKVEAMAL